MCSEVVTAFCARIFSELSLEYATCVTPRRRDPQIPRLLAASDKNEGKSFAGSPLFFGSACAFATPFLEIADSRKIAVEWIRQLPHLLTQSWQVLHVSLAALDFLRGSPHRSFPAFDEFVGEFQMAGGQQTPSDWMFLTMASASSIRFEIELPGPGLQRTVPSASIHAHRIIQNINLRVALPSSPLSSVDVFFAVPVAVNFGPQCAISRRRRR